MRRPLVAGNWKMNGTRAGARELVQSITSALGEERPVDVAVCPPMVLLDMVANLVHGTTVALGAQNVASETMGAYTGEVAAEMLAEAGCTYVLVGHSERRQLYGESDALVADKARRVLDVALTPVLCLGETLDERDAGDTNSVVARQLDAVVERCGVDALARCVIAYEPVWAIGTGRTATPEQANDVHGFLRQRVAGHDAQVAEGLRILYGGSVKPGNAKELFAMPEIDGGLIGGASLEAPGFVEICRAAT
jgi:triosephosphate isomerase